MPHVKEQTLKLNPNGTLLSFNYHNVLDPSELYIEMQLSIDKNNYQDIADLTRADIIKLRDYLNTLEL